MDLLFSFTLTIIIYNIIKFILFKKLSPIIISIDGNIGSGKSTLIEKLKEKKSLFSMTAGLDVIFFYYYFFFY